MERGGDVAVKDYTTESGKFVLVDTDGRVIAKADVPPGTHAVPEDVDLRRVFDVDESTDLASKLSNSPANLPEKLPFDNPGNAFEKLANVQIDERHRP